MVWAAFILQVPGLALVRSTRAMPSVPTFVTRGLCVMVGSGINYGLGLQLGMCGYLKK